MHAIRINTGSNLFRQFSARNQCQENESVVETWLRVELNFALKVNVTYMEY
jgi:hypothetical protein